MVYTLNPDLVHQGSIMEILVRRSNNPVEKFIITSITSDTILNVIDEDKEEFTIFIRLFQTRRNSSIRFDFYKYGRPQVIHTVAFEDESYTHYTVRLDGVKLKFRDYLIK